MLRALFPLALLAFQAPSVTLSPTEGAKTVHAYSVKFALPSMDASVTSTVSSEYSKVTDEGFTLKQDLGDVKLMVGDQEVPAAWDPMVVEYQKSGEFKKLTGGVQGANPVLLHLLFRFVPAPAEAGKTTTVEFKGDGSAIPDQKVESTYVGPKKVDAGDGFEFKQKTTADGLTIDTDFVVNTTGTVLEASTKFTGMPIPAAGATADGTGTLKLKP